MAGAAPAAAAATTASEHTRGTLVWVRPAAAAAAGKAAAANNADDAEEWVKATVARVLDGGATLEVVLEGSNEEAPTISVSAADAPLQNPASRLGVEVRKRERELKAMESNKSESDAEAKKDKEARRAFFLLERRERPFAVSLLFLLLWAARDKHS